MPVKSVPIKLDKQRRLCFDFNAFAELQRECGISFLDLQKFVDLAATEKGGKAGVMLPFYELRGFIWAGLLDETPDITVKEVGKILDDCVVGKQLEKIGTSLVDALMESAFLKEAKKKVELTTVKEKTGVEKTT